MCVLVLADPRCPHEQKKIRDNELAYLENSEEQGYRNRYRSDSSCRRFAFQHWTSVLHSVVNRARFHYRTYRGSTPGNDSIIRVLAACCENVV